MHHGRGVLRHCLHHRLAVLGHGEIVAGHSKYEKYILDTHDHAPIDPVWRMYARAIRLCGSTATLLEWDAHIPSFDEVHRTAGGWKMHHRRVFP